MDNKVRLVHLSTDDWEALYSNGRLISEGHRLDLGEILSKFVGRIILSYDSYYIDIETMEENYGAEFPVKLDELKEVYMEV